MSKVLNYLKAVGAVNCLTVYVAYKDLMCLGCMLAAFNLYVHSLNVELIHSLCKILLSRAICIAKRDCIKVLKHCLCDACAIRASLYSYCISLIKYGYTDVRDLYGVGVLRLLYRSKSNNLA